MPKRIAVIAVHGVADQQPGETAIAISEMLANLDAEDGPAYGPIEVQTLQIAVRRVGVPNEGEGEAKTFDQRAAELRAGGAAKFMVGARDINTELMATMLAGYEPEGPDETYETTVHRTVKAARAGQESRAVDVYEMYWADLSRLSQNALRIFSELYQMLFHLGSLGVHAVRAAQAVTPGVATDGRWDKWGDAQRRASNALAAGFVVPNLLLVVMLVVLMTRWPPLGLVVPLVYGLAAVFLIGGILYRGFWREEPGRWLVPTIVITVVAGVAGVATAQAVTKHWIGESAQYWLYRVLAIEALAGMLAVYAVVIGIYAKYRPEVIRPAKIQGTVVGLTVFGFMWLPRSTTFDPVLNATLRGGEVEYAFLGIAWIWFTFHAWRAFVHGRRVVHEASQQASAAELARLKRTNWTARLTLALPAAMFLIVTVSLWAAVWYAAAGDPIEKPSALEQPYHSMLFNVLVSHSANAWEDKERKWIEEHEQAARDGDGQARVTLDRYRSEVAAGSRNHTRDTVYNVIWVFIGGAAGLGFGPLLIVMTFAAVIVIYAMAPVVIAERFPPKALSSSRPFGAWLDEGYLKLRTAGRLIVLSVLIVVPVGMAAMVAPWELWPMAWRPAAVLTGTMGRVALSQLNFTLFQYIGLALVPAAAGLFAFSGKLKALLLGFREILDVALDVDNYLREHPLRACPRARMAGRFASLLRHVYLAEPRYDGVVIIAHSQGTVLSADVLRLIRRTNLDSVANPEHDPGLAARGDRPLHFFTMGSPLRQLYGLRFPHLYQWARHELADPWTDPATTIAADTGPDPQALGVTLWVNVYRSADYIGRHLWRPDRCDFKFTAQSADAKRPWQLGTFTPVASITAEPKTNRMEYCIGAGAHTHYWDETAPEVALQLDALIAAI